MGQSPTYQCYVGSLGWDHADWSGAFYPDDLPPEWRLTYYNNFFNCVYLRYEAWSGETIRTLSQWLEDTLPSFRFLLEVSAANPIEDGPKLQLLTPRTGLVVGADPTKSADQLIWIDNYPDAKSMSQKLLLPRSADDSIYAISSNHRLESMRLAQTLLEVLGL